MSDHASGKNTKNASDTDAALEIRKIGLGVWRTPNEMIIGVLLEY